MPPRVKRTPQMELTEEVIDDPELRTFVAYKECGCLVLAVVDEPAHRLDTAKEVSKAIRDGLRIERLPTQKVREMPWRCSGHTHKGGRN